MFIGVDGSRGGWVVAVLDGVGTRIPRFSLVEHLDDVFRVARLGRALVVVDIPIGLPNGSARRCDVEARRLLGRARASSVFPAPSRAALDGLHDYRQACRLNERACGRRLTRQAFNLLPRIAAVDALVSPAVQARVREGHPELIFRQLAGRALASAKRTPEGVRERLAVLGRAGVSCDVEAVRDRLGRAHVAADDILDAAACAVAARRLHSGRAIVVPAAARERDPRGLRMEIVG